MAHSPHSSLSTPTPASLGLSHMSVVPSPPRAPPSPPNSDTGSRLNADAKPFSIITTSSPTSASFLGVGSASVVSSPEASASATLISTVASSSISSSSQPQGNWHLRKQTPSSASSQHCSPFASPNKSSGRHSGQINDSDVEVYLNGLGLHSPVSHAVGGSVPGDSPVLPATSHYTSPSPDASSLVSPKVPCAPAHQTIPLPDIEGDFDNQNTLRPQAFSFEGTDYQGELHCSLHAASDDTRGSHNEFESMQKTPNVYINGLPPHFPEDQLFALASPYGDIRSVRTFTRHVRDSESGYGFVLFETIDAAERCILSLRRYRNLHPTFSKQIHKIPGTLYAQSHVAHTPPGSVSSLGGWEQESRDSIAGDASFKAKMESLHDATSTNLYMEGLPLSIDEPTLAALVSPHRISSSRFFQTRLSNPPRIIAFVRLETRVGAEEIIERLHGRMVRGWNDAGSRISVRFADTSDQRELRRSERLTSEEDPSPGRLSIAQAALLNLRGPELRAKTGPVIHTQPPPGSASNRHARVYERARQNDFQSNAHQSTTPFAVDYSLAPGRNFMSQRGPSPMPAPQYQPYVSHPSPHPPPMDPAMIALLESLRSTGTPYRGHTGYYSHESDYQPELGQHVSSGFPQRALYDAGYYRPHVPPVQTRGGYTATEEYIMRAHAESNVQRRRPAPLDLARRRHDTDTNANINLGVRGYRTQASAVAIGRNQNLSPNAPIAPLPQMSEDEFHSGAASRTDYRQLRSQQPVDQDAQRSSTVRHNHNIHPAHVNARLSRDSISRGEFSSNQQQQQQQQQPQQQPLSPDLTQAHHYQHAHLRSTTLPHRSSTNQQPHQRHYQHSSMSIPNKNIRTPQHPSTSIMGKSPSIMYENDQLAESILAQNNITKSSNMNNTNINNNTSNYDSKAHFHHLPSSRANYQESNLYDHDQASPSLISPALTYSSHSPSTLSPATPFFGSFNSQSEGFERTLSAADAKKIRAGGDSRAAMDDSRR